MRAQALLGTLRLTGNLNVAQYVSYAPTGATKLVGGGFQAGTLTLCNHSLGGEARQIILSPAGVRECRGLRSEPRLLAAASQRRTSSTSVLNSSMSSKLR